MKAQRKLLNDVLILAGIFALVVLTLPLLAAGAFVLRGAFLIAVPVALVAGTVLWLASASFRAWFGAATSAVESYKGLQLATDVALGSGHAWARTEGRNVTVGADDLLASALGPADHVDLPAPGRQVLRGEVLFSLRRGDRDLEVRAPVSGTVTAANAALAKDPGLLASDPFRRGWAVKLTGVPEIGLNPPGLRRGQAAATWFRAEVDRFLATISGDVAAVPAMADGGVVTGDVHRRIDDETWVRVKESLGGARS
jgi:glycine cleavage system H protein